MSSEKENLKRTPLLENHGRDLTKEAREGLLDPVIGRDKEIKRVGQILSRRKKNNAILIGAPGVGKSAIPEGLAQRIVNQNCSPLLFDKRIILLDIASIVAGTKYRGQFEERMKTIMTEAKDNKDIILFIDEIHTIIGAGASSGSGDASNMIKPALANGELQVVGVTTLDEYQKTIEKDGALDRRFQKVIINQTTPDETEEILNQIKGQYEKHHIVIYSNLIIKQIVQLADRYLANKNFPDKAIDIMDETGSYVRGVSMGLKLPVEIIDMENEVNELQLQKKEKIKAQLYEEAGVIRDKEAQLVQKISECRNEWLNKIKSDIIEIKYEDIATIVSAMSGIPLNKLTTNENEQLSKLDTLISTKRVIGQEKAVKRTVKELQKLRLGIKDPNKPTVFLYLGTTGVGKTELAKAVAEFFFCDKEALVRINMNEYGDSFSKSRIGGAPPGYTGYDEGGELTNQIKNKPYCVVLMDEIEKAHEDVWNIFLQVWDEGFMKDSQGYLVDFRNVIFILTSNIGTDKLAQFGKGIGYSKSTVIEEIDTNNIMLKELEKKMKFELLNRIDDIIVFNSLGKKDLYDIIELQISSLKKRLSEHFELIIPDEVKDLLIEDGYDERFGARPLKRSIAKLIENSLVDLILQGIETNSVLTAKVENKQVAYTITKKI